MNSVYNITSVLLNKKELMFKSYTKSYLDEIFQSLLVQALKLLFDLYHVDLCTCNNEANQGTVVCTESLNQDKISYVYLCMYECIYMHIRVYFAEEGFESD